MITSSDILIFSSTVLITSIFGILFHILHRYTYWKKRGVRGPKPEFFFGNLRDSLLLKRTEPQVIYEQSLVYKDDKYYGIYSLWKPVIVIKNLELIKEVMEKKFEYFMDHPAVISSKGTDLIFKSLFTMTGEVWKSRRNVFTRLFTPMRLKEYSEVNFRPALEELQTKLHELVVESRDLELFDVTESYSIHAISAANYGINLIGDEKRTTMLKEVTRFFLRPTAWSAIKFLSYHVYPKLLNLLRVMVIPRWHWYASHKFTEELLQTRKNQGSANVTNVLSLSAKLLNEGVANVEKIPYVEAVAHVYAFLQAGTHTTQITLCHVLHRLSQHQDVQEKLRKEISSKIKDPNLVTYEEAQRLTYLDNIITETLRLAPPLPILKRVCVKDCTLDEGRLTIEKGTDVYIDCSPIHLDEQYFPDPETFNPDRHSTPGEADYSAFLPFGKGLRTCIGMQFAMLEVKLATVKVLTNFIIRPSKKMLPMKFDPQTLFFCNVPVDGIWVYLEKIEK